MNWTEIKKKYPKAFELLSEFTGLGRVEEPICYLEEDFDDRDLYDFFDEQGIHPIPEIDTTMEVKFSPAIYTHSSENLTELEWRDEFLYRLRPEAEEPAFEKAFEILEERP